MRRWQSVENEYHRLSAHHAQILRDRAVWAEAAFAAGLRSDGTDIVIPYRTVGGEVVHEIRRPDVPPVRDGKALKYVVPKNAVNRLYVVDPDVLDTTAVPLFVCESPFKALALRGLFDDGRICATAVNGVWGWRGRRNPHSETAPLVDWKHAALAERTVIVVFDSDAEVNMNVTDARQRLTDFLMDEGARVFWTKLPGTADGHKNGIDDLIAGGWDVADIRRATSPAEGERLLDKAFRRMDPEGIRPVKWFWRDRIPAEQLTIFAGLQGLGKSQCVLCIAAEATKRGEQVLVLSAEDTDENTVWPRLMSAGANAQYVRTLQPDYSLWLPKDFEDLRRFIHQSRATLVILDPIIAFIEGKTDSWKDQDVRAILRQIRSIAMDTRATILGVMHPKKGAEDEVVNIISGAVAWTAAPRSTLVMTAGRGPDGERLADDDPNRVLFHVKCNVGPTQPALECVVLPDVVDSPEGPVPTSRIEFGRENPALRARDHVGRGREKARPAPALERGVQFLADLLADGPRLISEVEELAKKAGITEMTLRRARDVVGAVRTVPPGDKRSWLTLN